MCKTRRFYIDKPTEKVHNKKKIIFSEEQLAMVLSAVCLLTGFSGNQSGVSSAPQELPRFPNRRQRTSA